jgi:hypothetical protein
MQSRVPGPPLAVGLCHAVSAQQQIVDESPSSPIWLQHAGMCARRSKPVLPTGLPRLLGSELGTYMRFLLYKLNHYMGHFNADPEVFFHYAHGGKLSYCCL